MLDNIKSNYILRIIIKNHLNRKSYLSLFKKSNKYKKKLEINLKDYETYFYITKIELFPIPYQELELGKKYYFMKTKENIEFYNIYFTDNGANRITRKYITKDDKVNKINIEFNENIKAINGLFYDCNILKEIKFTKFNRNDFTDLSNMFYGCERLSSLDITKLKTPYVTDMKWMFALCKSLTELNIINFDTSNVNDMTSLFSGCIHLQKLNYNFNTKKVESMRGMFFRCMSMKKINISKFDTNNLLHCQEMFYECISLQDIDIRNFRNFGSIKIDKMFGCCSEKLKNKLKKKHKNLSDDAFKETYY